MRVISTIATVVVALCLGAGNCGPTTTPPPPGPGPDAPTCSLTCADGFKVTLEGLVLCECRPFDCTANEPPIPRVNPETGVCTGFPTDCDSPADWAPCSACATAECGPSPGPREVCSDGSVGGNLGCTRTELGTCDWAIFHCPVE